MNPMSMVFIVDDDSRLSASLDRLVRSAGYRAATFGSAREFLESAPGGDMPGCVLLEMHLPDSDGFRVQEALAARRPALPIVFLTGHGDIRAGVRAIKAGAVDFLTKPCPDQDLLTAIGQALARSREALGALENGAEHRRRLAILTRREREVLGHVVAGRLNKHIAAELGTCEQTIKVHRMRIREKLGVTSVAELARLAEKAGIGPSLPSH